MKCLVCKLNFYVKPYRKNKAKFCSYKCYWYSMKGMDSKKHSSWKGNKAGIKAVHKWLGQHYGKPKYCINFNCLNKSNIFEWCKKIESSYTHNPNDYLWLCRSCHRKYDWTQEKKEQAIKNLIWYNYI